ncbi:MAG: RNA degradosome polyphosphate kinase, partial [Thermoanaerobaculia bacterium]|nr:RNA degradosome polyphosphate kinase [Thermoanaerobaculia bacterium]
LMPRNLGGRVEILFPVLDRRLAEAVRDDILFHHLGDNVQSRRLGADGRWERVKPAKGEKPLDSQAYRLAHRGSWHPEE